MYKYRLNVTIDSTENMILHSAYHSAVGYIECLVLVIVNPETIKVDWCIEIQLSFVHDGMDMGIARTVVLHFILITHRFHKFCPCGHQVLRHGDVA